MRSFVHLKESQPVHFIHTVIQNTSDYQIILQISSQITLPRRLVTNGPRKAYDPFIFNNCTFRLPVSVLQECSILHDHDNFRCPDSNTGTFSRQPQRRKWLVTLRAFSWHCWRAPSFWPTSSCLLVLCLQPCWAREACSFLQLI